MYGLDQIGSTLGNFIDAVLHPSVANLPAGFLVLVFAVLIIAALPEDARQKMRLASLAAAGCLAISAGVASVRTMPSLPNWTISSMGTNVPRNQSHPTGR